MRDRREFLRLSAATAAWAMIRAASAAPESRSLNLLFLGGTGFLGPFQVEYALARGHRVTLFNRGRGAQAPYGGRVEVLIGDRDSKVGAGLSALQGSRQWDAVIDNSGYVPRHVSDTADLLGDRVRRYIYTSTVAVYPTDRGGRFDERSVLRESVVPATEVVTGETYGPLKADCERALAARLGQRLTNVRPTYVVGPGDETDRFTYWVQRVASGGRVLGPPDPDSDLQWIDVRDLCPWIVSLAERDLPGDFVAAGPRQPMPWRKVLGTLGQLSNERVEFRWAKAEAMRANHLSLPLVDDVVGKATFVGDKAAAHGLRYRPLLETASATLEWWNAQTSQRRASARGWPTRDQEQAVITAS